MSCFADSGLGLSSFYIIWFLFLFRKEWIEFADYTIFNLTFNLDFELISCCFVFIDSLGGNARTVMVANMVIFFFPIVIPLFKVNIGNTITMCEICSKLKKTPKQNDVIEVILVSLLQTLNRFYIWLPYFHWPYWTKNRQLDGFGDTFVKFN